MSFINHYLSERKQDWQTPPEFYKVLHRRFYFDLDGACTHTNRLARIGSTQESPIAWNGLRVFCNPPWTNIRPFIELAPFAEFACFLVPARVNAKWFHRALELGAQVEFFSPRPKFLKEGEENGGSPFDCCLLLFGEKENPFQ